MTGMRLLATAPLDRPISLVLGADADHDDLDGIVGLSLGGAGAADQPSTFGSLARQIELHPVELGHVSRDAIHPAPPWVSVATFVATSCSDCKKRLACC